MRINRLELIAKIQVMIAEREKAVETQRAEAEDKIARSESEYVAEHSQDWNTFANRIKARVRREQPVTMDDVPEGLRSRNWTNYVQVFSPSTIRESDYVARTEPLTRLIAVLESCPDEFISTSALDRIGAPLRELMRP